MVVTVTVPCAHVTLLGLHCDVGNRTRALPLALPKSNLTQLAGCARPCRAGYQLFSIPRVPFAN